MNEGIIVKGKGSIGVAQSVTGTANTGSINQNGNIALIGSIDTAENTECLKDLLEELQSELSEHKSLLDKLSNKVSIIDAELDEKNPDEEKITKYKKDLLSTVHQVTGTICNLYNILKTLQSY